MLVRSWCSLYIMPTMTTTGWGPLIIWLCDRNPIFRSVAAVRPASSVQRLSFKIENSNMLCRVLQHSQTSYNEHKQQQNLVTMSTKEAFRDRQTSAKRTIDQLYSAFSVLLFSLVFILWQAGKRQLLYKTATAKLIIEVSVNARIKSRKQTVDINKRDCGAVRVSAEQ